MNINSSPLTVITTVKNVILRQRELYATTGDLWYESRFFIIHMLAIDILIKTTFATEHIVGVFPTNLKVTPRKL